MKLMVLGNCRTVFGSHEPHRHGAVEVRIADFLPARDHSTFSHHDHELQNTHTPTPSSPLRANCCVTMFLQRSAFAVARRAVIRPVVARSFTSSIVRRKLPANNAAAPPTMPQLLIQSIQAMPPRVKRG